LIIRIIILNTLMKKKRDIDLYKSMLRIRLVEEKISSKYQEQKMRCPVHLSIGQEACAVGVCNKLEKNDLVLSAHRSHAHYLAKGGSLKKMLSEIYGKKNGCAGGKGGSMHLIDQDKGFLAAVPIVGSTIPIGVGVAWGLKLQKKKNKVCIFFGDGATEEGVFQESLNFASLHNLEVLFICENNYYSVYSPLNLRRNSNFSLKKFVEAHNISFSISDGNNVMAVENATHNALKKMKITKKSAVIELKTYRWLEHCGPNWDDHLGYRKKDELKKWLKKDPLVFFEKYLKKNKILTENKIKNIKQEINIEIIKAFKYAEKSKFPNYNDLIKNIYSI